MSAPIMLFDPYLLMLSIAALFIWALFIDEVEKQKNKKLWKIAFYGCLIAFVLIGWSPVLINYVKYWRSWMVAPLLGDGLILFILWAFIENLKVVKRKHN
jgi:hypothetical protein